MMSSLPAVAAALAAFAVPQEDREAVRRTYEAVRPSFVGLDIALRRKTRLEKAELEEDGGDAEAQRIAQLAENGQLLEAWGVAVAEDAVLMSDRGLKDADIERITATDATGARFDVVPAGTGRRHDFVVLKPKEPRKLTPLAFSDWTPPRLGETFHVTYADHQDGAWQLNVSPYIQTNAPLVPGQDWFCLDHLRTGSVVCDAKGVPVGVALDAFLWVTKEGRSSFLGKALLADERVTDLETRMADLRARLAGSVKRIEILFRSERPVDRFMPADDAKNRAVVFGVPVDDEGTLFVAEDLPREQVRRIEDLWSVEGDTRMPARFAGLWRAFGGFLVKVPGLKTVPAIALDGVAPPPGELFFAAALDDRFGRVRIRLETSRVFRQQRGIGGAPRLQPKRRLRPGTLLLDFDGRLVGCATVDRKEEDIDEVAAAEASRAFGRSRFGFANDYLRRLLWFSEIAGQLDGKPGPHFDPRAVPLTRKEDKRLVWLGVEFQEMSKPLAEALGVQDRDLTNDGRRGLWVTEIYAGSPAARAGIALDDILLTVQPEGEAARDLVAETDRFAGLNPRGMLGERRGGGVTPWRAPRNYLTNLLTEIGAGRKAVFEVLRGRERRRVELALEHAPTDYETAERHKDEGLGFTVKELTYEVRHVQKLDPSATGVVVARVESGSKSDVAKLASLSIITKVNDATVKDLAHFRSLIAAAKGFTLTTVFYGQTKLVELSRE
jgi:S1-C subfamily serine protease